MFHDPIRWVALALAGAVLLIQYPLWLGKGGWLDLRDMQRQVSTQRDLNAGLRLRNAALEAEVRDLQSGTEAVEERARLGLGLVQPDEIYIRLIEP
ncbi:MAG: cell division protein FtsB [Pigmentiphaga sp.]|nr:cell division protein FtsB [Pigmentiphaga sp.]